MKDRLKVAAFAIGLSLLAACFGLLVAISYTPSQPSQRARQTENNENGAYHSRNGPQQLLTILSLITGWDLEEKAAYCAQDPDGDADKWLHKYQCDVKLTDQTSIMVAIGGVLTSVLLFIVTMGQLKVSKIAADAASKAAKAAFEQVDAAQKALPRAWIYIEFNEPGPRVTVQGGDITVIQFSIRNHGTTPATIKQVDLRYYFGGFDDGKVFDPRQELVTTPFEIGELGKPTAPIYNAVECKFEHSSYVFDGTTISPNQSAPEGIRKGPLQIRCPAFRQSGHIGFRGKEIYVFAIIKYSDPNGTDRETGYLGHVRANDRGQIVESNDPRYSYHR